jgi:8-oxo-dGTP diphosphatase
VSAVDSDPSDDREPVNLRCSVLVFRGSTVLLCQRNNHVGTEWILPGGTPRRGESAGACALREAREETGIEIDPTRIAFVLDATNARAGHHLIEIVFLAREIDSATEPQSREPGLVPQFIPVNRLAELDLRPPIGGHIAGFHGWTSERTAAYLGNLWRPI